MKKTALFVDFDNAYLTLRELNAHQAEAFANKPHEWASEIAQSRKLLLRRCYMNPQLGHRYRLPFVNAGFDVVDCPALTAHGKTATDMHICIDMLDALVHPTRFDEFMLFSGDADFAPILKRVREHDRTTIIIPFGPVSNAYRASADQVIKLPLGLPPVAQVPPVAPVGLHEVENEVDAPCGNDPGLVQCSEQLRELDARADDVREFLLLRTKSEGGCIGLATLGSLTNMQFGRAAAKWFGLGKIDALIQRLGLAAHGLHTRPGDTGHLYWSAPKVVKLESGKSGATQ